MLQSSIGSKQLSLVDPPRPPAKLDLPRFPQQTNNQNQHHRLNRVLIALKGIHQIIRKRIDEQKWREQPPVMISAPQRQYKPSKGEHRLKQKLHMARHPKIVAAEDYGLWRRRPEIPDALQCVPDKFCWVVMDELVELRIFFIHEANLA